MKKTPLFLAFLILTLLLSAAVLLPEGPPVYARDKTPGLVIYGYVRTVDGQGVPEVTIYRGFAGVRPNPVAITDQDGFYQSPFQYIPNDEMVAVSAGRGCYSFVPAMVRWRHYGGYEKSRIDFTAYPASCYYFPFIRQGATSPSSGRSPAR